MNTPQPSFSVRVDVTNPGQFFACCGLLELAHRLWPGAQGWFQADLFNIASDATDEQPLDTILETLTRDPVQVDTARGDRGTHPVGIGAFSLTIDWWIDPRGDKTALKLWAGQQTSLIIVEPLREALRECGAAAGRGLFEIARPLTGRFGLDPRAAWRSLDVGFSPNEQGMQVATFPAVELLAAVGLQRFRPVGASEGTFIYATWGIPLPPLLACAAAAGALPAGRVRTYRFEITARGKYKGFSFATYEEMGHER